jgi:hypothetical protein
MTTTRDTRLHRQLFLVFALLVQLCSSQQNYYWETTSLGGWNYRATLGNPLRGLGANSVHSHPKFWPETIQASLHFLKFGWDEVMKGDPDVVGVQAAFNWTVIDQYLLIAQQYRCHVTIHFYAHFPGESLNVPEYLLDDPYDVQTVWDGEVVPWYGDKELRRAMKQFIEHLARRYDGDRRIFAFHAGLVGYWGEWHTGDCTYNWEPCDPDEVKDEVVGHYARNFKQTKIQFRYPSNQLAYQMGGGFHDGSFTYYTVTGDANGNRPHGHFFNDLSIKYNTSDAWKKAIISGEVRPENTHCFTDYFGAPAEYRQDFQTCAETIHATYADWNKGFFRNGVRGDELEKASLSHSRLGYSFVVKKISVFWLSGYTVNIDATIQQVGIAPFYYPLRLNAFCDGKRVASTLIRADLSEQYSTAGIRLQNIPATTACLGAIQFRLGSKMLYSDRPIKWAQGRNGKVILKIPLPQGVTDLKPEPDIRPDLGPIPFYPPDRDDEIVNRCFVICAARYCPNGRRMGDVLRGLNDDDEWSMSTTGNLTSIRCDIDSSDANSVMMWLPGVDHKEATAPWSLGGNYDETYIPVDYLKYPGHKVIKIEPYDDYDWLGRREIDFDILP